jgi:O-methyltransferase
VNELLQKISPEELAAAGFELRRLPAKTPPISLWEQDERFQSLFAEVRAQTRVDPLACFNLYQLARQARALPGNVAEVGVFRGGSAYLLARCFASTDKSLHLFDTFQGMPRVDPTKDGFREGAFSDTSLAEVQSFLAPFPRVHLYPGFFPQTSGPVVNETFCFVHVDVDIYTSVRDCCDFFYSRMVPGGILLFDDYGFVKCAGARMAVDEFFASRPESPCYLPTGQSLVIKH